MKEWLEEPVVGDICKKTFAEHNRDMAHLNSWWLARRQDKIKASEKSQRWVGDSGSSLAEELVAVGDFYGQQKSLQSSSLRLPTPLEIVLNQ